MFTSFPKNLSINTGVRIRINLRGQSHLAVLRLLLLPEQHQMPRASRIFVIDNRRRDTSFTGGNNPLSIGAVTITLTMVPLSEPWRLPPEILPYWSHVQR